MYKKLINELKVAAKEYYQSEGELMTDNEYDTKLAYLEDLVNKGEVELTDEVREILYDSVSAGSTPEGTVVFHDYPMLSLGKAKNSDELSSYHKRLVASGAKGFTLQMKFDGLALSAKYTDGHLVQLATRGDGVKGESLNHLINNKNVTIVGLPKSVDTHYDFELRGELYLSDAQFKTVREAREKATGNSFSNSRNAATGIVRGSEKGLDYNAELTFTAYSAYHDGEQIAFDSIENLKGVSIVGDVTEGELIRLSNDTLSMKSALVASVDFGVLEQAVADFGVLREQFGIPTDGVVIKPTNEIEMLNKMGFTSHHPVAYIAFKYPGTKALTTVEDIIVTVGKTGRLTPQAKVTPVEVDGVVISSVTCHNYSWLSEMGIRVGSTVSVTRANDVIPAIDTVVESGPNDPIATPTHCPECGEVLLGDGTHAPKTLTCENLECPSRLLFYMRSVVSREYLYLEGLGNVALDGLVEGGVLTSVVDLFKLDEDVLANTPTGITSTGNVRNLGAGNAKNIINSINTAKENTDSNKLLAALNIGGMGPGTAKRLIAHFGGIKEVLTVSPNRLREVNQVGDTLVHSFTLHQARALEQLNELIDLGVKLNDPKPVGEIKGSFSVSGGVEGFANRSDFVKHMEGLGWEFHKSPKKDTTVLFADPAGTSSKIKKARDNGTRIIDKVEDL